MDLDPMVREEWREHHCLSRRSLRWIEEHADGQCMPVCAAIDQLRAEGVDRL